MDRAECSLRLVRAPMAGGSGEPRVVAPVSDGGASGILPADRRSPGRRRVDPDVPGQSGGALFGVYAGADLVGTGPPAVRAARSLDAPHHTVIEHRVAVAATARSAP
jgi:hypothetical protein